MSVFRAGGERGRQTSAFDGEKKKIVALSKGNFCKGEKKKKKERCLD